MSLSSTLGFGLSLGLFPTSCGCTLWSTFSTKTYTRRRWTSKIKCTCAIPTEWCQKAKSQRMELCHARLVCSRKGIIAHLISKLAQGLSPSIGITIWIIRDLAAAIISVIAMIWDWHLCRIRRVCILLMIGGRVYIQIQDWAHMGFLVTIISCKTLVCWIGKRHLEGVR